MAQTVIDLPAGTNSWVVPLDCILLDLVECHGDGGSGAACGATNNVNGGGGGAYAAIANLAVTPGATIQTHVGEGGAAVSNYGSGVVGNDGTHTWFNGTSLGSASCSAEGGKKGNFGIPPAIAKGGQAANSIGTTKFNGGDSPASNNAGAGASAGPHGAGANGTVSNGGQGDNGNGGLGGTGGNVNVANNGAANANGGGGGGTATPGSVPAFGGKGGYPGGGSGAGGASGYNTGTSGTGAGGRIRLTYTPVITSGFFLFMGDRPWYSSAFFSLSLLGSLAAMRLGGMVAALKPRQESFGAA